MKFDKYVNRFLKRVFGPDKNDDPLIRFHSQNLNEDSLGEVKGLPWRGRWWLASPRRQLHRFEWSLKKNWYIGFGVRTDTEDNGILWNFGSPFGSVYVGHFIPGGVRTLFDGPFWKNWNEKYGGYKDSHVYTDLELAELQLSWLDDSFNLSWSFLKFDWGWSNKMPKWMDGRIDLQSLFLGDSKIVDEEVESRRVQIPMPEGDYPATAKIIKRTLTRPRSPFSQTWYSASVDMDEGWHIPYSGKGENSWDCGEDGLFGSHFQCDDIRKSVNHVVNSVLETRRKRGDPARWKVYPPPPPAPRDPGSNATEAASVG